MVGGEVAVSAGDNGKGVSEATNRVLVAGGASVNGGGLDVGMITVGEAVGGSGDVELGCGVGEGMGVFVGRASARRVLVGVGISSDAPGRQARASRPTKLATTRRSKSRRRSTIANPCPTDPDYTRRCIRPQAEEPGPSTRLHLAWTRCNALDQTNCGAVQPVPMGIRRPFGWQRSAVHLVHASSGVAPPAPRVPLPCYRGAAVL